MRIEGTIRKTLDGLLVDSDMITLCLSESEGNKNFLSKERIERLKEGSVVVNIGNRNWVDEKAMNEALITRRVDTYAFVAESMGKSPLRNNEYALMSREFNTYTKETLKKNTEAMVRNIGGMIRGMPFNRIDL
jgi:lactate dehydrogenase-like 2-hydroxyacid dehydrogenase